MELYYITLVLTYITSLFSNMSDKQKYRLLSVFWISLATIILIIFSGLRNDIGDTLMYKHSYDLLVLNPTLKGVKKDVGFTILSLFLIKFSANPQTLVFIVALITIACTMFIFYKYRSSIELQIFFYIASGYFTVTMNGMRQCLAAALMFLCTPLIIKGHFKKFLICILLISTIHKSVLIMIPIYFISRIKPWTKKFYIIIAIACFGLLFYNVLSTYLFKVLQNTQYGEYAEFKEGGSSIIRTVVNTVPLFLAYIKRDELKRKWPESDIFVNLALVNCIFVAFGMANWIFNRFSLYMQLFNIILLPFIIKECFKEKERRLLYFFCILCYFIFFYREQVIGLNLKYTSILNLSDLFYKNIVN